MILLLDRPRALTSSSKDGSIQPSQLLIRRPIIVSSRRLGRLLSCRSKKGCLLHTPISLQTYVDVPLDVPVSAIAAYVEQATRELFALFDGYTMPCQAVEYWTKKLVERNL
jgi:hypothetical protein